jgi:hypothetical protein
LLGKLELTTASNRPSVRSVFPSSDRKEEKKTRSGFSTHSNSTTTPSKGKGKDSETTIRGTDKEKEKEKEGSWGRKRGKRTPLLIKHLGGVERRKGESYYFRVFSFENCRCEYTVSPYIPSSCSHIHLPLSSSYRILLLLLSPPNISNPHRVPPLYIFIPEIYHPSHMLTRSRW